MSCVCEVRTRDRSLAIAPSHGSSRPSRRVPRQRPRGRARAAVSNVENTASRSSQRWCPARFNGRVLTPERPFTSWFRRRLVCSMHALPRRRRSSKKTGHYDALLRPPAAANVGTPSPEAVGTPVRMARSFGTTSLQATRSLVTHCCSPHSVRAPRTCGSSVTTVARGLRDSGPAPSARGR